MRRLENGLKKEFHPFACSLKLTVGVEIGKRLIFFNVLVFLFELLMVMGVGYPSNQLFLKRFSFNLHFKFIA